ncbi:hypothetical protein M5689_000811 [Euphorbia peplus]|nr:hypothetical protein M5689_000811 [Euphorbia peplus]
MKLLGNDHDVLNMAIEGSRCGEINLYVKKVTIVEVARVIKEMKEKRSSCVIEEINVDGELDGNIREDEMIDEQLVVRNWVEDEIVTENVREDEVVTENDREEEVVTENAKEAEVVIEIPRVEVENNSGRAEDVHTNTEREENENTIAREEEVRTEIPIEDVEAKIETAFWDGVLLTQNAPQMEEDVETETARQMEDEVHGQGENVNVRGEEETEPDDDFYDPDYHLEDGDEDLVRGFEHARSSERPERTTTNIGIEGNGFGGNFIDHTLDFELDDNSSEYEDSDVLNDGSDSDEEVQK